MRVDPGPAIAHIKSRILIPVSGRSFVIFAPSVPLFRHSLENSFSQMGEGQNGGMKKPAMLRLRPSGYAQHERCPLRKSINSAHPERSGAKSKGHKFFFSNHSNHPFSLQLSKLSFRQSKFSHINLMVMFTNSWGTATIFQGSSTELRKRTGIMDSLS